jgi:hypothetical protein
MTNAADKFKSTSTDLRKKMWWKVKRRYSLFFFFPLTRHPIHTTTVADFCIFQALLAVNSHSIKKKHTPAHPIYPLLMIFTSSFSISSARCACATLWWRLLCSPSSSCRCPSTALETTLEKEGAATEKEEEEGAEEAEVEVEDMAVAWRTAATATWTTQTPTTTSTGR